MRVTNTFLGTLREAPAEATKDAESYKLMLRGGVIRKHSQGEYKFLPLGMRICTRFEGIMDEIFEKQNFIKSEVEIEDLLPDIKTHKQIPLKFYSTKERLTNEKPKYGTIKSKRFKNIEGFSLHRNLEELDEEYKNMELRFIEVFNKIKMPVEIAEAYSKKEKESKSIFAKCDLGDEYIVECTSCSYKASMDAAESMIENVVEEQKDKNMVYTPNIKSIEDLAKFFNISTRRIVKTLIIKTNSEVISILIRGDRELDESKLKNFLGHSDIEMADANLVTEVTNADVGFAGPIGIKTDKILIDEEVTKMYNFIVGANKTDHHIENVNYLRDFTGEIGNFRKISHNDKCPKCGSELVVNPCFKVATLNKEFNNKILNYDAEDGSIKNPYIASYKIALTRNIGLIAEHNRDENGIKWPLSITPYEVDVIVAVTKNQQQLIEGEKIYNKLKEIGIKVLFDDREDRAGSKFKDCDLIGVPLRITVGKKISEGLVEFKKREDEAFLVVTIDEAIDSIVEYLNLK